jgi:hypothetical protein
LERVQKTPSPNLAQLFVQLAPLVDVVSAIAAKTDKVGMSRQARLRDVTTDKVRDVKLKGVKTDKVRGVASDKVKGVKTECQGWH